MYHQKIRLFFYFHFFYIIFLDRLFDQSIVIIIIRSTSYYYASKSFIGAQAFGVRGIMETNPVLIEGMRHFLDCSDQIIVICDSSKFDLNARVVSCPIDRITKVITDSGITDVMKNALNEMGVEVIISCDP